jgi:hypothetical protein
VSHWRVIGDDRVLSDKYVTLSFIVPFDPVGDVCTLPVQRGQGVANLQRWFYNIMTRTCDLFTYGGVLGGQNMFLSRADCEAVGCPREFVAFSNRCVYVCVQFGATPAPWAIRCWTAIDRVSVCHRRRAHQASIAILDPIASS